MATTAWIALVLLASVSCAARRAAWPSLELVASSRDELHTWRRPRAPDEARAEFESASRFAGLGRLADAIAALERAQRAWPGYLEADRLLQDLLLRTSADWWLRERFSKRLAASPQDADSWYLLARVEPDPARQLELFEAALARDPNHAYATLGRAISLARRGDLREALKETRRAAELAPWLALPWIYLGGESLKRGDPSSAARLFSEATDRDPRDVRGWLGLAEAWDELGERASASRAAVCALRIAPGDEGDATGAVQVLVRGGVPEDLAAAGAILSAAVADGADAAVAAALRGRLLLAAADPEGAVAAFEQARALGVAAPELSQPLRLARVAAGRYREAVAGALEAMPAEAFEPSNLYAPRWRRLRDCAEAADARDPRTLLALAEAMASVGWLDESRCALVRARAAAPLDGPIAARAAAESAYAAFVDDLGRLAREARSAARSGGDRPTAAELVERVAEISRRRLRLDASHGAVMRSYPLLGEFAVSVASGGDFETVFGSHGLLCLVGARSGGAAEIVLGRIEVVRAGVTARAAGVPLALDECWIESAGLPDEAAGLRRGLAGLTLDRLVLLQLDVIRRAPRRPEPGIPFLARPAGSSEELRSLDTPSDVAGRIEARLAAEGTADSAVIDAVRRHELVHVADARRMLPFHEHPLAAISFLVAHGFSGAAAERALEARAQALSIADAAVPRAALAALLAFLPAREGETPHAAAYREAAQMAVDIVAGDSAAFPSIDRTKNALQQFDLLTDAEIRELGRRLARKL